MRNIAGAALFILVAAICSSSAQQNTGDQAALSRLAAVLEKSEEYCRRLDRAALDFICLEEVTELSRHFTLHTSIYLYDYQFVRKDQKIKEKRALLAVDGEKTNVQDSSLNTAVFRYENVLFGPIGLLSKFWQAYHVYKIIGDDEVNKVRAVVIEATPGPELAESHCYGRLWVDESDGSVLKIVWDQKSLGNFQSIAEWAKTQEAEPQITSFTEYGFEKNGLRFPSRNYSEQAYIKKGGQKFVNARISIIYKDYKFFTVETETKYK